MVRILLIRSWLHSLEPLRAALRAAGLEPHIRRVDIEPALHAALGRRDFDVVVLDPRTPGMSRDVVDARLREHDVPAPLVFDGDLEDVVAAIVRAMNDRRN